MGLSILYYCCNCCRWAHPVIKFTSGFYMAASGVVHSIIVSSNLTYHLHSQLTGPSASIAGMGPPGTAECQNISGDGGYVWYAIVAARFSGPTVTSVLIQYMKLMCGCQAAAVPLARNATRTSTIVDGCTHLGIRVIRIKKDIQMLLFLPQSRSLLLCPPFCANHRISQSRSF